MSKINKTLFIAFAGILAILLCLSLYNFARFFFTSSQVVKVSLEDTYLSGSSGLLEVRVANEDTYEQLEADIRINLLNSNKRRIKELHRQQTNNFGYLSTVINIPEIEKGEYFLEFNVRSKEGRDKIYRKINIDDTALEQNIIITLDKPLYRPGDPVKYGIMVLSNQDDTPIEQKIDVSIFDGNDNRVYFKQLETSQFGVANDTFNIANEVNNGIYSIKVDSRNFSHSKEFEVTPYVLPSFNLEIETDKQEYKPDEEVSISIFANYFFGEPVSEGLAKVSLNGDLVEELTLDEQGNATLNFLAPDLVDTHVIDVSVVDNSNNFIETSAVIQVVEEDFGLKIIKETDKLLHRSQNEIYFFTYNHDGTPLKTNIRLTGDIIRELVTDDNGFARLSINPDSLRNLNFSVHARDLQNRIVRRDLSFGISEDVGIIIRPERFLYSTNEDISLELLSNIDITDTKLYFAKNEQILHKLPVQHDTSNITLPEDTYGLIDIFAVRNEYQDGYSSFHNGRKVLGSRSIFIRPEKGLNINVSKDSIEYRPGENLTLSFLIKDLNQEAKDTNLMLSILDSSLLALGRYDLSLDNIKLAIDSLETNTAIAGLDLYTAILNNSSDTTLAALLSQRTPSFNPFDYQTINNNQTIRENRLSVSINYLMFSLLPLLTLFLIKFSTFRQIFLLYILQIGLFIFIFINIVIFLYQGIINSELFSFLFLILFSLYLLFYNIHNQKGHKTIIKILMLIGVFIFFYSVLFFIEWVLSFLDLITLSNNEENLLLILTSVVSISGLFFLDLLRGFNFKRLYKLHLTEEKDIVNDTQNKTNQENEKTYKKSIIKNNKNTTIITIISCIIIAIILFIAGIILPRYYSRLGWVTSEISRMNGGGSSQGNILSSGSRSPFSGLQNDSLDTSIEERNFSDSSNITPIDSDSEKSMLSSNEQEEGYAKIERVRRAFLENMYFNPQILAKNGETSLTIPLADNITTWNMQVVANTLTGDIGSTIDNFRVFQEFFVDFTLPRNLTKNDEISIPVTIFNYLEESQDVNLKVHENSWFKFNGEFKKDFTIAPNETKLIYIPIKVLEFGDFTFRVDAFGQNMSDAVEKNVSVKPDGFKITQVASIASTDSKAQETIGFMDDDLKDTRNIRINVSANPVQDVVEGLESMLRFPRGCFEQLTSSLYPNILVLDYLRTNDISNPEIENRALEYIESGFQTILTYEVGRTGGFSLYGNSPAEIPLTAYGLMQFSDLQDVYPVDDRILDRIIEFLFSNQNSDGSFDTSRSYGSVSTLNRLPQIAYIAWAMSNSVPEDNRLLRTAEYLKKEAINTNDNYTLALIANVLVNIGDDDAINILDRILNNMIQEDGLTYVNANSTDYFGTRGVYHNLQTTALTSIALTRQNYRHKTNDALLDSIRHSKDAYGTFGNTQSTILSLKALLENHSASQAMENTTIVIDVNGQKEVIEIKDNSSLDLIQRTFTNITDTNTINIESNRQITYEIIKDYYVPYENIVSADIFDVTRTFNDRFDLNERARQRIEVVNTSERAVENLMVVSKIPQGFIVDAQSLEALVENRIIERFEYSYDSIYFYIRNFNTQEKITLDIVYRPSYPVKVQTADIHVYDYYNPFYETKVPPKTIEVLDR